MRVAALYDVHGNLPALEAVLADVEAEGVDAIVFGGDIASGPFPRETVDLVRSLDAVSIQGNADVRPSEPPEATWAWEQLSADAAAWLDALPFSWSADDTLYVHANPVDLETTVTVWSSDEKLAGLLEGVSESRVVSGHVHMQFDRRVGGVRWIGAGSVGMPYESLPGAYWTLLEPDRARRVRTGYDLGAAAAAIRTSGYPQAEELAAENVLTVPSRDDVQAFFAARE